MKAEKYIRYRKFVPQKRADIFRGIRTKLVRQSTKAEILLLDALTERKLHKEIYFQYRIKSYFVDFFWMKKRIAIEIDGDYHLSPQQQELDKRREFNIQHTPRLNQSSGIVFIRFTNKEVLDDPQRVIDDILTVADTIPDYY